MKRTKSISNLMLLGAFGCAEVAPDPRAAFVQDVLVDDNRIWLHRDAAGVVEKFEVMSQDRYDFMRGSAALHFADIARRNGSGPTSRFLHLPDATEILLFGDPHPENATVCRADPSATEPEPPLTVEFIDLDAAGYGPWTLDVRRLALGMLVLMDEVPGCDENCQQDALHALARGYVDGLDPDAAVGVSAADASQADGWGLWFRDLFEESLEEGAEQKKVNKYAPEDAYGERALLLHPSTGLVPMTIDEERILDALTARMPLPVDFRLLGAARRLGSGVSSLVALRFVVLWDAGSDEAADDALLQMREVIDAPAFPGRPNPAMGVFPNNHVRVAAAARQLWSRPDADPRHTATQVDGLSWKTVSWTSHFQDVDHIKVIGEWEEGGIDASDLSDLARDLARVLGASHARTRTLSGRSARAVIEADLEAGGGLDALEAEVWLVARADLGRLDGDFEIFGNLLRTEGPLLGAETLLDGVMP
jgi:hypothetical protein